MTDKTTGSIFAYELNGKGGGAPAADYTQSWLNAKNKPIWLNITVANVNEVEHFDWLYDQSGLDGSVLDSLTARETRPRFYTQDDGLLVILRALDLNAGADPEDMLSVRVWAETNRVVTIQRKPVTAIASLQKDLDAGRGPQTAGDLLTALNDYISLDMADFLNRLDDEIDSLEDEMLDKDSPELRQNLGHVRRRIIHLRRYLAPQREVLKNLLTLKLPFISDDNRFDLREIGDRLSRYLEMLDSGRERATIAHDELDSRIQAQTNRTIFILSVVTVIFLPLSFLTSLLGVNVGGIPGRENKYSFILLCLILAVIAILEYLLFRKKKLL